MREVIHHWWLLAFRAGLAFLLAAFLFLLQGWMKHQFLNAVTIPTLIITLALYGIADSLLVLYLGLQFPPHAPGRSIGIAQGLIGMAIGVLLVTEWFRPAELFWFVHIITAQAIATGTFEILSGLRFTKHVRAEWTCFATGIASLSFAAWLEASYAHAQTGALNWFLGYALLLAVSMAVFSFTLWSLDRELRQQHPHAAASDGR